MLEVWLLGAPGRSCLVMRYCYSLANLLLLRCLGLLVIRGKAEVIRALQV